MNQNLKKYLPFILLGLGVLVLVGVFILVKGKKNAVNDDMGTDEAVLMEVPLAKRPILSLTPDGVGHYLKLRVEKINIEGAKVMEYELLYQIPDHPAQGTQGEYQISGSSYENSLLLGTESSGKFRYDEGVESGTITLRFRNEKGKLVTKFSSEFHMQENPTMLTSQDGKLSFKLTKPGKGFFITMPSVGLPKEPASEPKAGPYVIHSSNGDEFAGAATIEGGSVYHFENDAWKKLDDGASKNLGYFIGL